MVVSTIILLRQCIIPFMSETINTSNRQIARAAGTVMVAFALSQLIGLVRGILVAKTFGLGPEMDAFGAANVVPNLLFSLVAGGALVEVTTVPRVGTARLGRAGLGTTGVDGVPV